MVQMYFKTFTIEIVYFNLPVHL